jgi:hypothetical protein
MILQVKSWPESQEVMENPEWFFIEAEELGGSCYAKIIGYDVSNTKYFIVKETFISHSDQVNRHMLFMAKRLSDVIDYYYSKDGLADRDKTKSEIMWESPSGNSYRVDKHDICSITKKEYQMFADYLYTVRLI